MAGLAVARASRSRVLILASVAVLATGQSQYFEWLRYRDPTQCERMQCMSVRSEYCREHLDGVYLKEKGCPTGQICTNCDYGNNTHPTLCRCENPPFSIPVLYGQECNMGQVCMSGEGMCFRPCPTYLHVTFCEGTSHCRWNTTTSACETKPTEVAMVYWSDHQGDSTYEQGESIVSSMADVNFPLSFPTFEQSASGFTIRSILIEDLIQLESIFLQLDENNDGMLDAGEYGKLPGALAALDSAALAMSQASDAASAARLLQTSDSATSVVRPEACGVQQPRKFYCSFDQSCKIDCMECGWKSATDRAFSICVRPTPQTCHADGSKEFCPSDQACHPNGDCSLCVDRPIVDHAQHMCLALWWKPEPPMQWSNWVCRERNKVGMPCRNDQDCVYGMKRCLEGTCQPLQPYNENHTCESDMDCPHLGYYCPEDPTGGENQYWVQYCRQQKDYDTTCSSTRQCPPDSRCNTAEPQPRCRRVFSLEFGILASEDILCAQGWRDRLGRCAPPAASKEAGRACDSDIDCTTTDMSGRNGRCVCKSWWDGDDAKYCEPVAGDYANHLETLRDYTYFRAWNCGSFWAEEDCLRVWGNDALRLKLALLCETQMLSGGPYLPPADCGVVDENRFPDYCAQLAAV